MTNPKVLQQIARRWNCFNLRAKDFVSKSMFLPNYSIVCIQIANKNNKPLAQHANFFCEECGAFSHKKKSHSFNRPTNHVKCLDEAMNPESADTEQYNYGRNIARAIKRFKNLKQVMSNERWFSGATCSAISACGPAIALPAAAAAGFAVGLVVVGILPVIGIGLATATEWILIDKQLKIKKISKEEATRLKKYGYIANGVTYGAGMAIGAALGFPCGPIGWVVGAFIGGIAFGLGSRY
eukprot:1031950_1